MYCTACGTQLSDTARFCRICGKPTGPGEAAGGSQVPPAGFAAAGFDVPAARRLRRIRARKKIAGVCAGFAEYFGMDVTLMRIIWVALLLIPPSVGLIGYIIAWVVLPVDET